MNQDEIDKIIADAVDDSKKTSRWHRPSRGQSTSIMTARKWLNITFMIGFAIALIVYFAIPEQKVLFFSVGFGAVVLKLIEFYLRFMF